MYDPVPEADGFMYVFASFGAALLMKGKKMTIYDRLRLRKVFSNLSNKLIASFCAVSIAASFAFIGTANAADVTIPDTNLAKVIRSDLGIAAGQPITDEAMLSLTDLFVPALSGVTSLEGLQYASNLNSFGISDAWLDQNFVPIEGLPNLNTLILSSCNIEDLSFVLNMPNLLCVDVTGNPAQTIPEFPKTSPLLSFSAMCSNIHDISGLDELSTLVNVEIRGDPLDKQAYDIDIPLIKANNPRLGVFSYDPIPEPSCFFYVFASFGLAILLKGKKMAMFDCLGLVKAFSNLSKRHLASIFALSICAFCSCIGTAEAADFYWIDANGK
jgi:hypothetical protein